MPATKLPRMGRARAPVDSSTYSGKIAVRIRALREARGLSVEELADKAGIEVKTLYSWESGHRDINPNNYPRLARALGCKSLEEFFPPLK